MSTEQNKAVARRFNEVIQEFWGTGNVDLLDDVVDASLVQHIPGIPPDLEGMKQALPMFRAAFPDLQLTIAEIIAERDKVVDRVSWRGTHQGEMMGIPPTGKRVTVTETHI